MLKPILTLVVCLIGGILWSRSEKYKRMVPIAIAFLPFFDTVIVQIPAVQEWYSRIPAMTAGVGSCTVGLGDFAFGGFLIGVLLVLGKEAGYKAGGFLFCGAVGLMLAFANTGLSLAKSFPAVLWPQTPWLVFGVMPMILITKDRWMWREKRPNGSPDVELSLDKEYRSEVKMMTIGCRLFTGLWLVASIVFLARL